MKIILNLLVFTLFQTFALAESPQKTVQPYSKSAGAAYQKLRTTKKTGSIYALLKANPKVLNPVTKAAADEQMVIEYLFAKLMDYDRETNEYFPSLAEKMEVSADYKSVTYTLRSDATWEDGSPITADDAEFTFQKIMDPKVEAAPIRTYFGGFKFTKLDSRTFKFDIENPDINSLVNIHSIFLLVQKKQFQNEPDFNKSKAALYPLTSGPYRIKSFQRDQKLELERNKNWWGFKLPVYKNIHNADQIVFRIISDSALSYEKFMKGELDLMEIQAEPFGTKVKGIDAAQFGTIPNDLGKKKLALHAKTSAPPQWTYIGWNQLRPMFQSKKTRQALAHLIDYDQIINRIFHGLFVRSYSPFGSLTENCSPNQKSKAFQFNLKKGLQLLKEDGWADTDADGVLDKMLNGKKTKFDFTLRFNSENPMRSKVAQLLKEQLKSAGVSVNVQAMEWNSLISVIDSRDFDAIVMGWANGNVHPDPRQIWHSTSSVNKGSNFVSYQSSEVDRLIDAARDELNPRKRFKIIQQMGSVIYDDQPYAFIAELPGFLAVYHDRIKASKWYMKYDSAPPMWLYSME